jgi:hypothetical protein
VDISPALDELVAMNDALNGFTSPVSALGEVIAPLLVGNRGAWKVFDHGLGHGTATRLWPDGTVDTLAVAGANTASFRRESGDGRRVGLTIEGVVREVVEAVRRLSPPSTVAHSAVATRGGAAGDRARRCLS